MADAESRPQAPPGATLPRSPWRWLLPLLLLLPIGGATVWRTRYTATATLYIARTPKGILRDSRAEGTDPETYRKTQVALLTDRYILAHALSKPEVAHLPTIQEQLRRKIDPEEWLQGRLRATFPGGSEVLEVSLSGDRPEDLGAIVNSVVDSYMTEIMAAERRQRLDRLDQLRKLWDKYQKDLKLKRKSLADLANSVGSSDRAARATERPFQVERIHLIQGEQLKADQALVAARTRLVRLEAVKGGRAETEAIREEIAVLLAQAKALGSERDRLLAEIRQADPVGLDLEAEKAEIEIVDRWARRIGLEFEKEQVELNAPDRVLLLSRAKVSRSQWEF